MRRSPAHEALDRVRAFDHNLGRLVHMAEDSAAEPENARQIAFGFEPAPGSPSPAEGEANGASRRATSRTARKAGSHDL